MKDEIMAILFGKNIANKIIAKHPNMQLVFTNESIGDQCMELAYLREYQRMNNIAKIGVLTTNPDHALFKYFSDSYDELIKISKNEYNLLLKFYKSDLGQLFRRREKRILCAFYTAYVRSDLLLDNQYIRLCDIEKLIYRLPLNTLPCGIKELDCETWKDELIKSGKVVSGKTVLINPYANSCNGVPFSFFEKMADVLQKNGYKVITGVHGEQQPILNTESIDFSLDKTIALANLCGYVVGLRSGFLDLCSFSKAKIVSIDHANYELADATRLEDWWLQNKFIKTFRYQKDEKQIIDDIILYLE